MMILTEWYEKCLKSIDWYFNYNLLRMFYGKSLIVKLGRQPVFWL